MVSELEVSGDLQQMLIEPPAADAKGCGTIEVVWKQPAKISLKGQLKFALAENERLREEALRYAGVTAKLRLVQEDLMERLARADARIDKLMGIEPKH